MKKHFVNIRRHALSGYPRCATVLLALMLASPAGALEFECSKPDDRRFIHVDMPGESRLCEVSVDYQGGRKEVLWYADHDTLFCSAKAYELRDKYSKQWNFDCTTWPDRDGIDQLSARNRYILDNQLKELMNSLKRGAEGDNAKSAENGGTGNGAADQPSTGDERVVSVKTAVSETEDDQPGTLAVQYFIGPQGDGDEITHDIIEVIVDEEDSWRVLSRIEQLADQIENTGGVEVDSAIITEVTETGLLKVSTAVSADDGSPASMPACQGEQYFSVSSGDPIARSPHRLLCGDILAGS